MRSPKWVCHGIHGWLAGGVFLASCLSPTQPNVKVEVPFTEARIQNLRRPPVSVKPRPIPGFSRGINLGNALDAPSEGEWGVVLSKRHFEVISKAGFDHVRLPVRFSAHADRFPPYAIDAIFFARVDWALDQAADNGLSVLLDMHHYEGIMEDRSTEEGERFWALWRQIAHRYKERPASVAFELLNEPCRNLVPARLNELIGPAIEIVRRENPTRLVFVDPYHWAAPKHLADLALPEGDDQVIATFHIYQPPLFTFQGGGWMEPEYQTRGVVFPGPPATPIVPKEKAREAKWASEWFRQYNTLPTAENPSGPKTVFEEFDLATRYVEKTGRRVYLGEFGAIDNADAASRARYVHLVRTEAERRGMGWAYWDDGGQFRSYYVMTRKWVPYLKRALLD